jgi:hypothetical protein
MLHCSPCVRRLVKNHRTIVRVLQQTLTNLTICSKLLQHPSSQPSLPKRSGGDGMFSLSSDKKRNKIGFCPISSGITIADKVIPFPRGRSVNTSGRKIICNDLSSKNPQSATYSLISNKSMQYHFRLLLAVLD